MILTLVPSVPSEGSCDVQCVYSMTLSCVSGNMLPWLGLLSVTVCCLLVSVPEMPEMPTVHRSSNPSGQELFQRLSSSVATHAGACSLDDFYLIVSSFPLSCWNRLSRFLICSSETEKVKRQTWLCASHTAIISPRLPAGPWHSSEGYL